MSLARPRHFALLVAAVLLTACEQQAVPPTPKTAVPVVSREEISRVASSRVLFAHQSVGRDILKGVREVAADQGVPLEVTETRTPPAGTHGIFHFFVGENGQPRGKIADFERTVGAELGDVDVAVLKLCFVDFDQPLDAKALAAEYLGSLKSLQERNPGTRIIAVTAPLTVLQSGPKAWVKRLMGREPAGYEGNERRETFNDIVRAQFPADHLFDLARLEARAGSTPTQFSFHGKTIDALDPTLSSDGAHLNDNGSRLAASAFLHVLAAR